MIAILGMDDGMIRFYNNVERDRMMVHMQLYRGSNAVVTQPDVLCSRRGLDCILNDLESLIDQSGYVSNGSDRF